MHLRQLIKCLRYEPVPSPEILKYYYEKRNLSEIKKLMVISKSYNQQYKRTCIPIYEEPDFTLKLIKWDKGAQTDIHRHDNKCSFLVLEGQLFEHKHKCMGTELISSEYNPSDVGIVDKDDFHVVYNIDPNESLSLHVYENDILSSDVQSYIGG